LVNNSTIHCRRKKQGQPCKLSFSLFLILTIVFSFTFDKQTYSWDTTAAKYYPLAVGNVWSYHYINFSDYYCYVISNQHDYIVQVVSDSIMPNGKKYFKVINGNYFMGLFQRIDSNTMNVYKWSNGTECITDSLFARKGDYFNSCRGGYNPNQNLLFDTQNISFAGQSRISRLINGNGLVGESYALMKGMGIFSNRECEFGGYYEYLNGCIINGIQYGTILGVNNNSGELPVQFSLYQNYPNPFNPTTKIKFSVPFLPLAKGEAEGVVKLIIYDILGREVATLVNEKLSPGTYEVEWDASNYPSGVYFYKLTAGDFTQTKKMLLIK